VVRPLKWPLGVKWLISFLSVATVISTIIFVEIGNMIAACSTHKIMRQAVSSTHNATMRGVRSNIVAVE